MHWTTTYVEYMKLNHWREIEEQIAYEREIIRSHQHSRSGPKDRKYQNKKRNVMSNVH